MVKKTNSLQFEQIHHQSTVLPKKFINPKNIDKNEYSETLDESGEFFPLKKTFLEIGKSDENQELLNILFDKIN